MRVLLVDDNKDSLATMAAMLRFDNYDVMTALDGAQALELANQYPPDVVLLDIGLPGMDGYAVARALRKQAPERTLFITAVTGFRALEDKERAARAGFDAFLTKPAHPFAIIKLLEEFESQLQDDTAGDGLT